MDTVHLQLLIPAMTYIQPVTYIYYRSHSGGMGKVMFSQVSVHRSTGRWSQVLSYGDWGVLWRIKYVRNMALSTLFVPAFASFSPCMPFHQPPLHSHSLHTLHPLCSSCPNMAQNMVLNMGLNKAPNKVMNMAPNMV